MVPGARDLWLNDRRVLFALQECTERLGQRSLSGDIMWSSQLFKRPKGPQGSLLDTRTFRTT